MIAHLVVPLLKSLGWTTEYVAIKWKNADIVLFRKLPRIPENIVLIIEAKGIDTAAESAFGQARVYANRLKVSCDLLVTDGIRYRLFDNEGNRIAYANLIRLKKPSPKLFEKLMFTRSI